MNQNSIKAFDEEHQRLSRREMEILGILHKNPRGLTDRQIMAALNYTDMNSVRPRCNELLASYWVIKIGDVMDKVTHKTVRLLRAAHVWERAKIIQEIKDRENNPQLQLL